MSRTLKTVAWIVAALVAVLAIIAYLLRDALQFAVMALAIAPDHDFDPRRAPPPPDYALGGSWAALPDRADAADVVPQGLSDNQAEAAVDVFFIHPTTYISAAAWNQPPDDAAARAMLDDWVLRGQASAFNGCCRIFAPRYRQATLYSFMDDEGNGAKALDLAYTDVAAAFDHFIARFNAGRPFIVAGHSQGARHAAVLLRERIARTPLAARLVAAYPVGYGIGEQEPGMPICRAAADTGCFVTWNAVGPQAANFGDADNVCVNPLSWRSDGAAAPFEANTGAFSPDNGLDLQPGVADARCTGGRLLVSEIRSDRFGDRPLGRDNYHIYDYGLYYRNIRDNAVARVQAFADARPSR